MIRRIHHTNSLSSSSLRSLNHDGKSDLTRRLTSFESTRDTCLIKRFFGQCSRLNVVRRHDITPIPSNARHTRILRYDRGADLVSQGVHGRPRRPDEFDGGVALGESVGQGRFFGGVAPASPHGLNAMEAGEFDDEGDVGVVVVIGASRDVDYDVAHADVFRIRPQILRSGHDDEGNGSLVSEHFIGPSADTPDGLHGRHSVVGNEHLLDDPALGSAELGDIRCDIVEAAVEIGVGRGDLRLHGRWHFGVDL
mmetsp:Transcript_28183/g.59291  ORF Transcript_28183/g.59291 Transcript_28183/m.59291 type:complete len:252 (+) Transcript_28183:748-1503(+)